MKNRAFTTVEMTVAIGAVLGLATLAVLVFRPGRVNMRARDSCMTNLKQIGLSFKQYIQDYDEKFPPLKLGKSGWMDGVEVYALRREYFQCPADGSTGDEKTTDYFYNAQLSKLPEVELDFISNVIMSGDGLGDAPPDSNLKTLPSAWASDANSPALRHLQGANYAFTDGHVKWLTPDQVSNKPFKVPDYNSPPIEENMYTFSIKSNLPSKSRAGEAPGPLMP